MPPISTTLSTYRVSPLSTGTPHLPSTHRWNNNSPPSPSHGASNTQKKDVCPTVSVAIEPGLSNLNGRYRGGIRYSQLEFVRKLGSGGQATASLARIRPYPGFPTKNCKLVAIKVMTKQTAREAEQNRPGVVNWERQALTALPWSPFIANLVDAFHGPKNIYLAIDFIPHGNLTQHIQVSPIPGPTAKFYFSNLACALEFIHSHGIIHRDIKPDNLLLDSTGYLVLTDVGASEMEGDGRADGVGIGTLMYMSPESWSRDKPGGFDKRSIDWWASGCVLFEMLTQGQAFVGDSHLHVLDRIMAGKYRWPRDIVDSIDPEARDLVGSLLSAKTPVKERLGNGPIEDILTHPWFKGIDWRKMRKLKIPGPYVPPSPAFDPGL